MLLGFLVGAFLVGTCTFVIEQRVPGDDFERRVNKRKKNPFLLCT